MLNSKNVNNKNEIWFGFRRHGDARTCVMKNFLEFRRNCIIFDLNIYSTQVNMDTNLQKYRIL